MPMEKERILKKNEIIFSDTLGVCQVAEVSNLTTKKGDSLLYYRLQSVFNKDKFSYIPAHGHQMKLREIISVDDAEKMQLNEDFLRLSAIRQQEIEYVLNASPRK